MHSIQSDIEAVRRSRDYVLDKIIESVPAPKLNELDEKLKSLAFNLSRRQIGKLIPAVIRWLSSLASSADDEDDFNVIGQIYHQLLKLQPKVQVPKIQLSGEIGAVINSIYWINGNPT